MINLSEISTRAPQGLNKKEIEDKTKDITKRIAELTEILYSRKDENILLVLQGMDSSGKDGTVEKVFGDCSPMWVDTYGFKKPTDEEFAHDFLWRVHKQAPRKGKIKVFVRSHYEDILIQRVHKWIDEDRVSIRIDAINAFEKLLQVDNNTTIIKVYLHLSKERQHDKLTERTQLERKYWKHNDGDWEEREKWDEYMKCYQDAINRSDIPWIIAPVDPRWYRNYFIANEVLKVLEAMNLTWPPLESKKF